jgi:histidine triad (HIT) family protein
VATVFTRIIGGELPGTFVWRDDRCVSFLSINPLRPGHALIVPRDEVDHWIDLEPDLARHLMTVAQTVARAQQRAFQPSRVGLIIAGMEVPHTHLHVIPIDSEADLQFSNAAASVTPDELEQTATALRVALRADGATGVSET